MKKCPQCGTEYPEKTSLCPDDGSALEATGDPLIGETLAGKYRIEERISVGGMGAVYRATHVLMDKKVALKVLRPSLAADETIVARFSREARAASKISHPNALNVTDFGEAEGGVVFLVMEFLNGRTLKEVIRQEGPLPLTRAVEIMRQVGSALEAAHAEGIIHRDLKSDNIMLLQTNGPDYAKVLDFGIAKIQDPFGANDPGLTSPDLVIGTPQYMSPEQCSQADSLDARSDIYSLGVILYEMLAGRVPFTGDSPTTVMLKQLQEPPPSVLDARSDLPAGVGVVVAKALAKRPDDRYQRVSEMIEDLVIAASAGLAQPQLAEPQANRIIIPTALTDAAAMESEETLVRPRIAAPVPQPAPANVARFNPWRIIIPSFAALLIVFGVIFVFTRNSGQATNPNQTNSSTLLADPNSQPAKSVGTPTGDAEKGIPAGGTIATSNANANANVTSSPSPIDSPNTNDNSNANSRPAASPTATRSPDTTASPSPKPASEPTPRPSTAATPPSFK